MNVCVVGYGVIGRYTYSRLLKKPGVNVMRPIDIDRSKADGEYVSRAVYVVCINPGESFSGLFSVLDTLERFSAECVVIESTLSVDAVRRLLERGASVPVYYSPERFQPLGNWDVCTENMKRLVAHACGRRADDIVASLYAEYDVLWVSIEEAVLSKLVENAWRFFVLSLGYVFEENVGDRVIELANTHPNVKIPKIGPGIGGLCLEKDARFFIDEFGGDALQELYRVGINIPQKRFYEIVDRIPGGAKVVGVYGKTYKSGSDIMTNSKALEVIEMLSHTYEVVAFDDMVDAPQDEEKLYSADVLVILVDHGMGSKIARRFTDLGKQVIDVSERRSCVDKRSAGRSGVYRVTPG